MLQVQLRRFVIDIVQFGDYILWETITPVSVSQWKPRFLYQVQKRPEMQAVEDHGQDVERENVKSAWSHRFNVALFLRA
jgi:hypothetical protein